jgi:hypothetical protein
MRFKRGSGIRYEFEYVSQEELEQLATDIERLGGEIGELSRGLRDKVHDVPRAQRGDGP